jgi:putative membrane protein
MEAQSTSMSRPEWQTERHEPDYRFSLANERTFIAWVDTALAVLAAAVLLYQLGARVQPGVLLSAAVVALALCAGGMAALAYRRWKNTETAMRQGGPLPTESNVLLVSGGVILVATLLAAVIALC